MNTFPENQEITIDSSNNSTIQSSKHLFKTTDKPFQKNSSLKKKFHIQTSQVQWTAEEDQKLINWVKLHGPTKWCIISQQMNNRNGNQCRARWVDILCPNIKSGNWSKNEDHLIIQLHAKYQNKWTKYSNYLPGRTQTAIRNRFNFMVKQIAKEEYHYKRFNHRDIINFIPHAIKKLEAKYDRLINDDRESNGNENEEIIKTSDAITKKHNNQQYQIMKVHDFMIISKKRQIQFPMMSFIPMFIQEDHVFNNNYCLGSNKDNYYRSSFEFPNVSQIDYNMSGYKYNNSFGFY